MRAEHAEGWLIRDVFVSMGADCAVVLMERGFRAGNREHAAVSLDVTSGRVLAGLPSLRNSWSVRRENGFGYFIEWDDENLIAFDSRTLSVRWERREGEFPSAGSGDYDSVDVDCSKDLVFVRGEHLAAFDAWTGAQVWHTELGPSEGIQVDETLGVIWIPDWEVGTVVGEEGTGFRLVDLYDGEPVEVDESVRDMFAGNELSLPCQVEDGWVIKHWFGGRFWIDEIVRTP